MADVCTFCGGELANGNYCPLCGALQSQPEPTDPLVGQTIAERYEIVELIGTGGMGRIYRAKQRVLDRSVAVKLVHPHLLSSEPMVMRFLQEARAASRLNHPNVVSIFDFGRATVSEGERLFLVMELLSGPDLAQALAGPGAMPLPRVANILRQVLAALAEAHHLGVTHRDMKPENVLLEPRRGGADLVKVIDFGLASLRGEARLTRVGECVGTPDYMSPEQIRGEAARPGDDLYATGVLLFRMLTGRVPFTGPDRTSVMTQHLTSRRPDPRTTAPARSIPAPLAEVCMRAIALEPKDRFPSAEALAEAVVRAATSKEWSTSDASLFPSRPAGDSSPIPSEAPSSGALARASSSSRVPTAPRLPRESLTGDELHVPLLGREAALAWAAERIRQRGIAGIVLWGPTGVGRSRLLEEVAAAAAGQQALVLRMAAEPRPFSEVGFGALRKLIGRLAGMAHSDPTLESGAAAMDPLAAEGLRLVFGSKLAPAAASGAEPMRAAAAALRWAGHRASDRAKGSYVLLALDDFDRLDSPTRAALADLATGEPIRRFQLALTTEAAPRGWPAGRVPSLKISGLPRTDAARLFGADGPLPERATDEFEPLYVEQLAQWFGESADGERPASLRDLVELRVLALAPALRRTLLAIAVLGKGSLDELAALAPRPDDLEESLRPLADVGFIEVHAGCVAVTHPLFARVALTTAPAGATADLHARRAETLLHDERLELRAYHAVRGNPDFEAFLLVEESARLRLLRGDHEAAIAALWDGMYAARSLVSKGEAEAAASAWIVFGRKLAAIQIDLGRYHEARTILNEIAERIHEGEATRIEILEQLAEVAHHLERPDEAQRLLLEATALTQRKSREASVEPGRGPLPSMPLPMPPLGTERQEAPVPVAESGISGPASATPLGRLKRS